MSARVRTLARRIREDRIRKRAVQKFRVGEFAEAQQLLAGVCSESTNRWTWLWSARVSDALGEPHEAIVQVDKALALSPAWLAAEQLRDQLLTADDTAQRLRGVALYRAGDLEEARALFQVQTQSGSKNEWSWLWAARTEAEVDSPDWKITRQYVDRALQLKPGWERAEQFRATIDQLEVRGRPVIVPLLGLRGKRLVELAQAIQNAYAPAETVVVTDYLDFVGLHEARIAFEYVPPQPPLTGHKWGQEVADFQAHRIRNIALERSTSSVLNADDVRRFASHSAN